jgi:hypothetical protein
VSVAAVQADLSESRVLCTVQCMQASQALQFGPGSYRDHTAKTNPAHAYCSCALWRRPSHC